MKSMGRKYIWFISAIAIIIMIAAIVLLTLYFTRRAETNECVLGKAIVIDHDGGADDAMGIFMALLYEKYFNGPKVIALTTTHGNVGESQVFINSQRILDVAERRDVLIYRGSSQALVKGVESDYYFGYDGLGDNENVSYTAMKAQPDHAVTALIELSKTYGENLSIITIASLTNIALAIKMDQEFLSRIGHLYVGAGYTQSPGTDFEVFENAEFNAMMDVEAYHIVAENATPDKVTVVPFTPVLNYLNLTRSWREDVLGAIDTNIMRAQNSYERLTIVQSTRWHLLDPAVVGVALNRTFVNETKYSNNSIILCGAERGVNTNAFGESSETNVELIYSYDDESYKILLFDIFSAELN